MIGGQANGIIPTWEASSWIESVRLGVVKDIILIR
jgi:hypothetical protein